MYSVKLENKYMPRVPLLIIALFFLLGGVGHFVFVDFFIMAMPGYLSYHKELVIISGIFELLGAVGILVPKTRLYAGYGLIALVVAVYPANINMALHPEQYKDMSPLFLYLRLPFQFLFVWFIWWAISPERLQNENVI
jgi:uncharacterized membrane protein